MSAERRNSQSYDPASSLKIGLSSLVTMAVAGGICQLGKIAGPIVETIIGMAGAVPSTYALLVNRLRSSPTSRAVAIAQNNLATNPMIVALLLGSLLVLVDSLVGVIIAVVAGETAAATAQFGASSNLQDQILLEGVASASRYIGPPLLIITAILAGRRAGHYIPTRPAPWFLISGGFYFVVRVFIVLVAGGFLSRLGIHASLGEFLLIYAIIALGLTLFLWLGSLWGRRSNDAFIGGRLLAKLPRDQRQAALDLLRESVGSLRPRQNS